MTAFFYGFAVYQTTREIKISAIHKGEAVAEALKDEVAYVLLAGNFQSLNYSFRRLASSRHDDIEYVYLLDTKTARCYPIVIRRMWGASCRTA